MPEFITLADGSLAVKGRNLIRNTQTVELSGTNADYVQSAPLPISLPTALQGQTVTASVQFDCDNAVAKTSGTYQRMGYEACVLFEDGTYGYPGCWIKFNSTPRTVHDRLSQTFTIPNKPIKKIFSSRLYLQSFTADSAKVSKPKLELGTEPTPYSPAPEDEEVN